MSREDWDAPYISPLRGFLLLIARVVGALAVVTLVVVGLFARQLFARLLP